MKQLKNLLHRPIQKTKKNHSPTSDAGNSKEANLQRNETPASSDNAHNIDNHDNVNVGEISTNLLLHNLTSWFTRSDFYRN